MPRKLGQHFLTNTSAIKKIIDALDAQPNDTIIEIGPGTGALTLPMAEKLQITSYKSQIIAIEKDERLAKMLEQKIKSLKIDNVKIIKGDALKELPELASRSPLSAHHFKAIGNIPYYITGKLLRILGDLITSYQLPVTTIVLMVQKEVAERITAKPPRMNLLAAATQFWAEPEILLTLKPKDFNPPPEIDSAVIRLTPRPTTDNLQPITYYKMIRIIFAQPRKTIFNNLRSGLNLTRDELNDVFSRANIDPNARPQDLSVEKLIELTTLIQP